MAIKRTITITADTESAAKDIEKLVDTLEDAEVAAEKTSEEVEQVGESAKKSSKGFKTLSTGVKGVGTALKAAGIGLIIAAIAGLTEAFSRNKTLMDAVEITLTTIGNAFSQVLDAIINTYNAVAKSSENFNGLGAVISGLITIALTPLKLTFYAIKLALQEAQLLWEKSFFGDGDPQTIKDLNAGILETKASILEVADNAVDAGKKVINNFSDAVGEIVNIGEVAVENFSKISVKAANEQAKAYQNAKNAATIALAESSKLNAQYEREAELQRQIRDNVNLSIEERKSANDELLRILNEQETEQLKQADIQIQLASLELQRNDSAENQAALIQAQADKAQILSDIVGKTSEQEVNRVALINEQNALLQTQIDGERERNKAQKEFEAEQELDPIKKLEAQREALNQENEAILEDLEAKRLLYAEGTQARIEAEEDYLNRKQEVDNQLIANAKETAAQEIKIQDEITAAKIKALDITIGLAKQGSIVQKVALIAKQAIATQELLIDLGAIKSKATRTIAESSMDGAKAGSSVATGLAATLSLGFPAAIPALVGYAAAAAGIVTGVLGAVKTAKTVASGFGGEGGGDSEIQRPTAQAPSFNIVEGTEGSQILDSLNSQDKVTQAYVVSGDVSTAQSLDRNIVANSSL